MIPSAYQCSICLERFPLSSTMLAHKLQVHLFTQAGWAKISTFLNDLFAEETLCVSDEEYNYTFSVATTVQKTPKSVTKTGCTRIEMESATNVGFLGMRLDTHQLTANTSNQQNSNTNNQQQDANISNQREANISNQPETKIKTSKSGEDKRRSTCALCGKLMYSRNMKRHTEIMHALAMISPKSEYKQYQHGHFAENAFRMAKTEKLPHGSIPNNQQRQHGEEKGSRSLCPICGRNMYTRNVKRHIEIRHNAGTLNNGTGLTMDFDSNHSSLSKTYENEAQLPAHNNMEQQPGSTQQAPVQISVMPDLPTRNLLGMIVDQAYATHNIPNMMPYPHPSNHTQNEMEQQPKVRYKDCKSKCPICEKEMYGRNVKRHVQVMHPPVKGPEQPTEDRHLRVD